MRCRSSVLTFLLRFFQRMRFLNFSMAHLSCRVWQNVFASSILARNRIRSMAFFSSSSFSRRRLRQYSLMRSRFASSSKRRCMEIKANKLNGKTNLSTKSKHFQAIYVFLNVQFPIVKLCYKFISNPGSISVTFSSSAANFKASFSRSKASRRRCAS